MEIVIVIAVVAAAGAIGYLTRMPPPPPVRQIRVLSPQRRRQLLLQRAALTKARQRRHHLGAIDRRLRAALMAVSHAPDFRRAANWAAHAAALPAGHRQKLFRAFRPRLLQHYRSRLAAGGDASALHESLVDLIGHLGVPAFEADYLRQQADGSLARRSENGERTYKEHLVQAQRDHNQRMEALRGLTGLDADMREQLVESELERFRQHLLSLGEQSGDRGDRA